MTSVSQSMRAVESWRAAAPRRNDFFSAGARAARAKSRYTPREEDETRLRHALRVYNKWRYTRGMRVRALTCKCMKLFFGPLDSLVRPVVFL